MDSKLQTASKHYELLAAFGSIDDVYIPCYKIKNARDRLDLDLGIIHHTKLGPIVAHADSIHIHKNEETKDENMLDEYSFVIPSKAEHSRDIKRDQALSMYFVHKMKPKVISRKLWLPVQLIYRDTDQVKRNISKAQNLANKDLLNREIKFNLIVPSIERVVKDMKYDWLTVGKIAEKVNANKFLNERISNYTVRKVLKQNMNYSYKRVGFRPAKAFGVDFQSSRAHYAELIAMLDTLGVHMVQIDEFSVGHNFSPSYSWGPKGINHFVRSERVCKSFSVMVEVSKVRLEYAFIYHGTTNHIVFSKFIESLLTQLKKDKNFRVDNSVFLFDGAAYHKTNSVDILLKSHKATAIIGVPYTPEFAFVEFFNNYVKSKLRMNAKQGR